MLVYLIGLDLLSNVFIECGEPFVRHMFNTHKINPYLLSTAVSVLASQPAQRWRYARRRASLGLHGLGLDAPLNLQGRVVLPEDRLLVGPRSSSSCAPLPRDKRSFLFARPMDRLGRGVPHAKSADEGVGIVAGPTSSWQLVHVNDVATTYYNVLGLKCRDQTFDHVFHELTPAFLAEAVEAQVAHVIFEGAFLIGQVTEFHRFDSAVYDHRRTESCSQS